MNLPAGPVEDTVARDMKVLGAKDFQLPAWMAEEDEDTDELHVLPENMDAVRVFFACGTQWHRGSKGEPTGLRYSAVDVAINRLKVADPDDTWQRVCVMEVAALKEFARKRA